MVGGYKATGSMRLANQKNPFREREDKSGMGSRAPTRNLYR